MAGLPDNTVLFRGGAFSNFALSPISLPCPHTGEPRVYPTVEHYFQACKAPSLSEHELVAGAVSPKDAKRLGRRIALRYDWEEIKVDVMLAALRVKFASDPFRGKLLGTGSRHIAEDSPWDFEWGARDAHGGYDGQNLLGRALILVRDELRASSAHDPVQLTLGLE